MPSLVKPGRYAQPLFDRTGEHDSPHGADMAQGYAQQTDTLVWRCSGATRTWVWAGPGYEGASLSVPHGGIPKASITAADTWTGFTVWSVSFGLPWRFTESFEKILFYTTLISAAGARLKVRWNSEQLVDAVASATGDDSDATLKPNAWPDMVSYVLMNSQNTKLFLQGSWASWLTPTVPANRRIELKPQVKAPDDDQRFSVSGTVDVWMVSVAVLDVPPRDSVGW